MPDIRWGHGAFATEPKSRFEPATFVEPDTKPPRSSMNVSSNPSLAGSSISSCIVRSPIFSALLFGAGGLALLLIGISKPAFMYFDEGYFVPEARAFLEGTPNPNPQCPPLAKPPLGKLIMAMGMKAAGDNPFGWRIASAVCGALTLTALYLWCFLLLGDARLACLATGLALLNNFVYVMSRIGTMDAFLLVFLIWSLVLYTAALSLDIGVRLRRFLFVCSGALIGLAGACKWNAIDTLVVFLLVSFVLLGRWGSANSSLWRYAKSMREIGILTVVLGLIVAPIVAYSLAFWPLCLMIHRPFSVHELAAMNAFMWKFNSTAISNKALTSAWYTWPMNLRPQRVLSYLVGNPVVTWGGLVALGFCAWRLPKRAEFAEGLVVLLFFSNYLQWAVTPEKGLFYYYYYPCVMILGVAIAVALRNLPRRVLGMRISLLVWVAAISVFVWCYPRMANLEAPWDCLLGCWS